MVRPTTEINKRSLKDLIDPLKDKSETAGKEAGHRLAREAKTFGLSLDDYLRLAVDLTDPESKKYRDINPEMDGFEICLAYTGLPTHNNYKQQIVLQQANDTFVSYPGTRVFFKSVIDSTLRWQGRQDELENITDMIASSRTITGNEMTRVVVEDDKIARKSFIIAQGGKVPVRQVKTGEVVVDIYKHGSGLEFTYEFDRRAALDIVTPFLARVVREIGISKVAAATKILLNGQGAYGAAKDYSQATLDTEAKNGKISYTGLLSWLTERAKSGTPIDTICGDYDAYMQYLLMLSTTTSSSTVPDITASKGGPNLQALQGLYLPIKFVLNTSVPAGKLLGFKKSETLEELVEAGSQIAEDEKEITNQTITYVRTENTGYSLIFGDTRATYTYKV